MMKSAISYLSALLIGLGAASAHAAEEAQDPALRQQAADALARLAPRPLAKGDLPQPLVEVNRESADRRWVIGSATQPLPLMAGADADQVPLSRLFLARQTDQGWQLAMEGEDGFAALLEAAPDGWLSADERRAWRSQAIRAKRLAPDATGLGLPWQEGSSWSMTGGPHGYSGESQPYDSIDFAGGDGRVLAPQAGVIYKSCLRNGSGLVKLVHDNGYSSTYYHMINLNTVADGQRMAKGAYLGKIGNGLPCGGSTTGPHVHFSLIHQGKAEPVNRKWLGGWQFFSGGRAYQGYASRNGSRVNVGGRLTHYSGGSDPAPTPSGSSGVATPRGGDSRVNLRGGPSLSAEIVGSAARGEQVALQCHIRGEAVDGVWGRTDIWNRTASGHWISDGFIDTGSNAPVVPPCPSSARPW
ncbi:M23 family metallopeptidase [Chromobacterium violaceum]|uniref:LasA protease n=1 Tax=Chromobacterium violaceum (strain ATCC 12472 / DSM 30191 / JCM 1249 / CCUG 213 / NBRC 12614 / NCIMB 9131 / NCTC 9757 / MK) TaxID=243365 RepID=Q7NUX6_CHRVO|nr:M23 family metallopeptidase [Chromobacterium violaceum]AAQ60241.1 LasA protease precursor [Chromobacterium violaceum ATCC 12472]